MSCKPSFIKHVRRREAQPSHAPGISAAEDEEKLSEPVAAVLNRREAEAIGGKRGSAGSQVQR